MKRREFITPLGSAAAAWPVAASAQQGERIRRIGVNGLFRCTSRAKRKGSLQRQGDGGDKWGDGGRGEIVVQSVT